MYSMVSDPILSATPVRIVPSPKRIAATVATFLAPALSTNLPPKAAARPRNRITRVNAMPTCSLDHPWAAMKGFLNTLHA